MDWGREKYKKRIDAYFYQPSFIKKDNILQSSKYELLKLSQIIEGELIKGILPNEEEKDGNVFVVQISNINKDGTIDVFDCLTAKKEIYQTKHSIKKNDVLVVITGATIGKVGLWEEDLNDYFLGGDIVKFRVNKKFNPFFVWAYLKTTFGQAQIFRNITGATNKHLSPEDVANIVIPALPIEKQNIIASTIQNASTQKRQKEAEAKNLLNSIDDFVLGELGIKMPEAETNNIFTISSEEIQGRIDPLYYSLGNIYKFLEKLPYKIAPIENVIEYAITGFASGKNDQEENGIIQLRPTNIGEDRQLKFDKNIFVKKTFLDAKSDKLVKKGEVLFNNTNSQDLVGKTSFFDLEGNYFCSNHITRIKTDEKLEAEFLTIILNIYQRKKIFFSLCTNWNNQSGVNIELLKTVKIPLPALKTQQKIAATVKTIYAQAKTLKQEAESLIIEAQKQVERMIFE